MAPLDFPKLPSLPKGKGRAAIGSHQLRAASALAAGMDEVSFTLQRLRAASAKQGALPPARLASELALLIGQETITGRPAVQMAKEIEASCATLAGQQATPATANRLAHLSEAWRHMATAMELHAEIASGIAKNKLNLAAFEPLTTRKDRALALAAAQFEAAEVDRMAQALGLDPLPLS